MTSVRFPYRLITLEGGFEIKVRHVNIHPAPLKSARYVTPVKIRTIYKFHLLFLERQEAPDHAS